MVHRWLTTEDGDSRLYNDTDSWSATESPRNRGSSVPSTNNEIHADAISDSVTANVVTDAIVELDMTGFTDTLAFDPNVDIDVDTGDTDLAGIITGNATNEIAVEGVFDASGLTSISSGMVILLDGSGGVTSPAFELPTVIVNTAGIHTLANAMLVENIEVAAGLFTHGEFDIDVSGTCKLTGGSWGASMTTGVINVVGDGTPQDFECDSIAQRWAELNVDAVAVVNLSDTVYVKKISGAGTIETDAAKVLNIFVPGVNDFMATWSGTITCDVMFTTVNNSPGADVIITDADLTYDGNATTLTMDGNIQLGTGTLNPRATADAGLASVDMTSFGFTGEGIVLGQTAAQDRSGAIDFGSGVHHIGSGGISSGNAANTGNAINFNTSPLIVDSGATITGANGANPVTCTNTSGSIRGGCTVTGIDLTGQGVLDCRGCTDGGGNSSEVLFGALGTGQRMMMGYGL